VLHRGFANGALEQENLIGQRDRVAMAQIDLELPRALLVDQRVDLETLSLEKW
jgi:predicted regulator of Ras-like GTPase activity (Roadblock/LC7/MglB family)